jgi:hypothetical protein
MSNQKATVYIDIDDEITGIIDKVKASEQKIVALVLPKRASVLQSIVNMKLLKRTADEEKKRVVLITSEAGILPLAGAVGVHVAKTLQSKPVIPAAPSTSYSSVNVTSDDVADTDVPLDPTKPIGVLAGEPDEETIEVEDEDALAGASEEAEKAVDGKKKFNKKLKVPNFDKFRLKLFLGIFALILVIAGWYMAFYVMPRAIVTVKTDNTTVDSTIQFIASPKADTLDEENKIIPAINKELKKNDTEKVQATGEKNNGEKATGEVTLSLTNCSAGEVTVPVGTGVSTNNLTFVTQEAATLTSVEIGGVCKNSDPSFSNFTTKKVKVTAQNGGDQYNISNGRTFTVAGYSAVSGKNDNPMTGGTSKIVKVVSQQDVDNVKQKLTDRSTETAKRDLVEQLGFEKYKGIEDTFTASATAITSTPKVGEEATEVTVTASTTFNMLGVKEDDLKKLIQKDVDGKIDKSKQVVLNEGLSDAKYRVSEKKPNGDTVMSIAVVVEAGPQLDAESIKREVAGKKKGQAQELVQTRPGIKEVNISYSPFWIYSTPKQTSKIKVVFESGQ